MAGLLQSPYPSPDCMFIIWTFLHCGAMLSLYLLIFSTGLWTLDLAQLCMCSSMHSAWHRAGIHSYTVQRQPLSLQVSASVTYYPCNILPQTQWLTTTPICYLMNL